MPSDDRSWPRRVSDQLAPKQRVQYACATESHLRTHSQLLVLMVLLNASLETAKRYMPSDYDRAALDTRVPRVVATSPKASRDIRHASRRFYG